MSIQKWTKKKKMYKALAKIEDANPNTLQDVLKGINFNRKVGQIKFFRSVKSKKTFKL